MNNRVFRTRPFTRWMRKVGISEGNLCQAVDEMARGLIDADLGGGVVKKRLALPGRGKRGGARALIATRKEQRWIFLTGFAENERSTVEDDEISALQAVARHYLDMDGRQLEQAIAAQELVEICCGGKEAQEPDSAGSA